MEKIYFKHCTQNRPQLNMDKLDNSYLKVRSLCGRSREKHIHIIIENTLHTKPNYVANLLGASFQTICSDDNYDKTFLTNNIQNRNSQYISNISPMLQDQIHLNLSISLN